MTTLASCEYVHSIDFVNKTGQNASIVFYVKDTIFRLKNHINKMPDTLIINLTAKEQPPLYNELRFGLGTWKMRNEIDNLVKDFSRIEINSWKKKIIYDNPIQIKELFVSQLKNDTEISIIIE